MDRRGADIDRRNATGRARTAGDTVPNDVTAAPSSSDPIDRAAAVTSARDDFAAWLRTGREARGMSIEDVARVTRIQLRALERLESASFDELPADVFVR